jgi:uncharacterized protein (DUF697 family)
MVATTMENAEIGENDRHSEAAEIISSAVKWSAAAGVLPLPFVDLIALGTVQYKMIRKLSKLYEMDGDKKDIEIIVSTALGMLAPSFLSTNLVGSSLKLLPGGGTFLGSASVAALSAAATYSIGKIFIRHFENGGTIKNFSAESIQDELKEEFANASGRVEPKKKPG